MPFWDGYTKACNFPFVAPPTHPPPSSNPECERKRVEECVNFNKWICIVFELRFYLPLSVHLIIFHLSEFCRPKLKDRRELLCGLFRGFGASLVHMSLLNDVFFCNTPLFRLNIFLMLSKKMKNKQFVLFLSFTYTYKKRLRQKC